LSIAGSTSFTSHALAPCAFHHCESLTVVSAQAGEADATRMEMAAFGKKRSLAVTRTKAVAQEAEPSFTPDEEFVPTFAASSRVPFLSLGLIAILGLIYRYEGDLVASGGLSGP
jgi:hypothetical protein